MTESDIRPTPTLKGKSAKRFYAEINNGDISEEQKKFLDDCSKTGIASESDDLLMDVLYQSCGVLDIIDNHCVSCYEDACVYLEKRGYLKNRNNRVYEILKR